MDDEIINTLLVDDSKAIRLVTGSMLKKFGLTSIDSCNTGMEALQRIRTSSVKYDLVFVDLNMPGMDGMELMRHLGKEGFCGGVVIASEMETRIINLASEVAKQNRVRLLGTLSKPISFEKLSVVFEKYRLFRSRKHDSLSQITEFELKSAISENRLIPYYQPKVDSKTNKVKSLEVLARIDIPGKSNSLLPGCFIPTAESCGMIDFLTFQLFERVLDDFDELCAEFGENLTLALNVSPNQLFDLSLTEKLDLILKKHLYQREQIVIEVTEQHALESPEQLETLNRLRMKGYGLSLDDFGTGFTNLQQLISLPFSEVKIDKSLISNIYSDQFSQVIVSSLLDISQRLQINIVAEGVECYDEFCYLGELTSSLCLQGFLISRPKPKESLMSWHRSWIKTVHQSNVKEGSYY